MKSTLKYLVLIAAAFLFVFSCNEDKIGDNEFGRLTGKVVASGTNEPLANVRISTDPVSSTVFTDSSGNFVIESILVGDYSVGAKKDGFLADFAPATINGNVTSNVVFELEVSTFNNRPPTAPELLTPADNEEISGVEAIFTWDSTDPEGDPIEYALELRNINTSEILLFENLTDTTLTYSELTLGTQYVWQVTATDNINDPVISPASAFSVMPPPVDNRILFVRKMNGNNVIFSSDDEGNEFQLTSSELNSYRPRRNVSVNKIAYFQTDGANVNIYIMNRDGTEKTRVTGGVKPNGFNLDEINFDWPEDSVEIYFTRLDKLYSIEFNGGGLTEIYRTPDGSLISEVAVSENNDLIVLKTNDLNGYSVRIYTINFAGDLVDTILENVEGGVSGLDLSITNQQILYSYDVSDFQNNSYRRLDSRMFIYDMVAMTTTDISDNRPNGTNDLEPIFSPNEAFVMFTNTSNDGISQKDVYTLEIGEENTRTLIHEDAFMPDWQ
jgi:Tol biopolymer transport system component